MVENEGLSLKGKLGLGRGQVKPSNLNRQRLSSAEDAGGPEAAVAGQRRRRLNPPAEVHYRVKAVTSIRRVSDLLEQHGFLLRSSARLGDPPFWGPDPALFWGRPRVECGHNDPAVTRYAFLPGQWCRYGGLPGPEFSDLNSAGRCDACRDRTPGSDALLNQSRQSPAAWSASRLSA